MPILRVKEIRDMSSEERRKRLGELRTELLRLKTMIAAGGTVENPARIRELRKTIARILTIEKEQEIKPAEKEKKIKPEKKETKRKKK
ncbi:MAG TPA: 50S ribosomal protein L29 [Acidobacteriota bacterium]|nr:50S ribosomal protein L29 [Acidobacteriota bacterium]